MKYYKGDSILNQHTWWIFEIFKNFRKRNDKQLIYKNNWIEFLPYKWGSRIIYQKAGYFDERPQIDFYLTNLLTLPFLILSIWSLWFLIIAFITFFSGIGKVYLSLPFKTGIEECESPQFGFYWYSEGFGISSTFWLWIGEKKKVFNMPWNLEWYRTSYFVEQDETDNGHLEDIWMHEYKGDRLDFYDSEKWRDTFWSIVIPYTYTLNSGEVQERQATIKVKEMEWRRKCLMFLPWFNHVVKTIEVDFNKEVGERSGSWKGGTVGCNYELRPNETPFECLRRMEKERKFK